MDGLPFQSGSTHFSAGMAAGARSVAAQHAYTDVQGLQGLKHEERDLALQKVAQQFEALFLNELLKTMRAANEVFEEGSLLSGGDTRFFRDMYDQQLSVTLSERGSGLAQVIYRQLSSAQPTEAAAADPAALLPYEPRQVLSPRTTTKASGVDNASGVNKASDVNKASGNDAVSAGSTAEESRASGFASPEDFVQALMPRARAAAQALGANPLILMAQAALETGWGRHVIRDTEGNSSHNLFNIKADQRWSGDAVGVTTTEYRQGQPLREQALFRKYDSFADSFQDYVAFLQGNGRYSDALAQAGDSEAYVQQLQRAGYATDPHYSNKVLAVYRQLSEAFEEGRVDD